MYAIGSCPICCYNRLALTAIKAYNEAIVPAGEVKDFAIRDFLQKILNDEDAHMDGIEQLQDQVAQMSLQVFLTTQVKE